MTSSLQTCSKSDQKKSEIWSDLNLPPNSYQNSLQTQILVPKERELINFRAKKNMHVKKLGRALTNNSTTFQCAL
jgi:hypothetical protein